MSLLTIRTQKLNKTIAYHIMLNPVILDFCVGYYKSIKPVIIIILTFMSTIVVILSLKYKCYKIWYCTDTVKVPLMTNMKFIIVKFVWLVAQSNVIEGSFYSLLTQ